MRGRIALIGCPGAPTPRRDLDLVRLAPQAIFRDPLHGVRAVVLGPVAMRELDPTLAWTALAAVRARVLLLPGPSLSHEVVLPWITCGFGAPVTGEDIADRLAALDRSHVRPWIRFDQWLPRVPEAGASAAVAATVVFRLPRLSVECWAAALHWSEHRLRRACRGSFGLTAKQVLTSYVAAAYADLRADGATNEAAAAALGYFDAPTLLRAVERGERELRHGTQMQESAT